VHKDKLRPWDCESELLPVHFQITQDYGLDNNVTSSHPVQGSQTWIGNTLHPHHMKSAKPP
jgi:hypothetical protein